MRKKKILAGVIPVLLVLSVAGYLWQADRREQGRRAVCKANLKCLTQHLCPKYAKDNDGRWPDRLSQLYSHLATDTGIYLCGSTDDEITSAERIDEEMSYVYVGAGLIDSGIKGRRIAAYDKPGNHKGGSNVAFMHGPKGKGYVEWVPDDKLKELLRTQEPPIRTAEKPTDYLAPLVTEMVARANAGDTLYFQNLFGGADEARATKLMEMIKRSGMETNYQERFTEGPVGIGHLDYHDPDKGCYFKMKLSPTEGLWTVANISFSRQGRDDGSTK